MGGALGGFQKARSIVDVGKGSNVVMQCGSPGSFQDPHGQRQGNSLSTNLSLEGRAGPWVFEPCLSGLYNLSP